MKLIIILILGLLLLSGCRTTPEIYEDCLLEHPIQFEYCECFAKCYAREICKDCCNNKCDYSVEFIRSVKFEVLK